MGAETGRPGNGVRLPTCDNSQRIVKEKPQLLVDSYGRRIATLRISSTDHCNFRCVYCMPPEGLSYLDKSNYLSIEHITRLANRDVKVGPMIHNIGG